MRGIPFQFEVAADFFEKADEEAGKRRRIGGVISTEATDRQGETVLADGLDFSDWTKNGWYNDNHTKDTDGIVGYPDYVKSFRKGQKLPNGQVADKNGHWAEGYMLGTERANRLWELGKALQGTGRKLGFSVEGKILRRAGPKTIAKKAEDGNIEWVGNRIAKALVRNVAITNCPVNTETGLEILARSITAMEMADPDDLESRLSVLEKAMAMGPADTSVAVANRGPQTGVGAGAVVTPKDLESDENPPRPLRKRKGKRGILPVEVSQKSLSDEEAFALVRWAIPAVDAATAGRIVELTKALKRSGRL